MLESALSKKLKLIGKKLNKVFKLTYANQTHMGS